MRNAADQEAILAPPQPIAEPKGSLRFTRAVFAGALLIVVIAGFVGYVGFQLVRFQQVPDMTLDGSLRRDLAADAQTVHLTGTSTPGFTIVVTGPGDFLKTVQTGDDTKWSIDVPVTKGQNDFTILARDPSTNRDSPPVNIIVTVPVPASPTPFSTATTAPVVISSAGIPIRPPSWPSRSRLTAPRSTAARSRSAARPTPRASRSRRPTSGRPARRRRLRRPAQPQLRPLPVDPRHPTPSRSTQAPGHSAAPWRSRWGAGRSRRPRTPATPSRRPASRSPSTSATAAWCWWWRRAPARPGSRSGSTARPCRPARPSTRARHRPSSRSRRSWFTPAMQERPRTP